MCGYSKSEAFKVQSVVQPMKSSVPQRRSVCARLPQQGSFAREAG
jgi:hypothetical protein